MPESRLLLLLGSMAMEAVGPCGSRGHRLFLAAALVDLVPMGPMVPLGARLSWTRLDV